MEIIGSLFVGFLMFILLIQKDKIKKLENENKKYFKIKPELWKKIEFDYNEMVEKIQLFEENQKKEQENVRTKRITHSSCN